MTDATSTVPLPSDLPGQPADWWRTAVIYEVYPRSFADSTGNGVGDLQGIRNRLPYIASLGVQGIWITPFQRSPQVDQGYDISDYCDVDPLFGTLADVDSLLAEAHALGLRVLVDIVPNHASVEHPLFLRAVAAGPGSPEREMFHFADGNGDAAPNNWISVFGGPAWHRVAPDSPDDRQWYLHLFSPAQPDWNWRNPAVVDYFDDVLRFWFERGADGIRIDVAHGLFKAEGMPDSPAVPTVIDGLRSNPLVTDQEPVHDVYRRWRTIADEYSPERLLVGEVNLEPDRAARYTRPDELHQAFAFAFARLGWNPAEWAAVGSELEKARREHGSAPSWALENHDLVRTVTRFGGGERGLRRARAGMVALLGLPGAVYLYQGQELALPEVDIDQHQRVDPMWVHSGIGRDGARIPLPWTAGPGNAHGFTTGDDVTPWLPIPDGWGALSVENQDDNPDSTLNLLRKAMRERTTLLENGLPADERVTWRHEPNGLVVCDREGGLSVAIAMGDEPVPLPAGTVIVRSDDGTDATLQPDTAAWFWRAG
ncbi:alpha-amylase [Mycetocola manganoxydans]|uniref:Alpha-amylase n=1 Tax=Mycetocola manganoxydans TaxID=699879 RepID=A0A3L6ZX08_9MICO|nr:alpha-amylase family glycosyl hydrolase [Mycetocola manganoxydans]RLP72328.1 alpha-amylase [Mycetocola manganoxydans]GHD40959.1 alpha-glucosidase [Mycetocola manganoxydans]